MVIEQKQWTTESGWQQLSPKLSQTPQLILAFGATALLKEKSVFDGIKADYPSSHIIICSTAGEIIGNNVFDGTLALTAIHLEKSEIKIAAADIRDSSQSMDVGRKLAGALDKNGLVHVMVFSDGLKVNGTALVKGMIEGLPQTPITGGLVGDGANFQQTFIGVDSAPCEGKIVAVGFYGKIKAGYGSMGGWSPFGLDRLITRSKENVLYEMDGKPALPIYKEYLGEKALGLPGTGLLFPLRVKLASGKKESEVVRTILAVDEKTQSMTFAGDMPEGSYASLMKASPESLIEGSAQAANMSIENAGKNKVALAILVSCVGRKLVLKERTEEEVEAAHEVIGADASVTGFYSYGEICPVLPGEKISRLHNQTMTITTFWEE